MAKKAIEKEKNSGKKKRFEAVRNLIANERFRFILGLVINIFAIYIAFTLLSFFFTGKIDQSKVENIPLGDLLTNKGTVANWGGVRGAYISDLLINRWFGVPSFLILFFLLSLGTRLMRLNHVAILRRFILCVAWLLWGSVFMGFAFVNGYEDTFLYLGGQHGYYCSEVLLQNVGVPGTVLLLVGTFLILAVFMSKKTVPLLQRFFSFEWLLKRFRRRSKPAEMSVDMETPVPDTEEVEEDAPETEKLSGDDSLEYSGFSEEVGQRSDGKDYIGPEEEIADVCEDDEQPEEESSLEIVIPQGDILDYNGSSLGDYDPRLDLSSYVFPTLGLLRNFDSGNLVVDNREVRANEQLITKALEDFGIKIADIRATVGPTVTLYEIVPQAGVRISKIKSLEDDIALNLSALQVRIIAPMPGQGTIGIEVPNKKPQIVSMKSVMASVDFQECRYELPVAMGKTITDHVYMFDLTKTPHLLVAGATGQGKSVGLNAIITSLLYKKHPAELKFVMVDPKMVEFSIYSKLERHYLAKLPNAENPIVTEPLDAVATLNSLVIEMENRYKLLVAANTRNIKEYNSKFISRHLNPNKGHRFLPYIVVIVDEFADLIATSGREIELPISRIAAKARAVGIHMILATQRPDTKVITGTIKGNFPSRIAFKVASMVDSRTILDAPGANRLIGRGDMLISVAGSDTTRMQCAFVDTPEVEEIVDYIGAQTGFETAYLLPDYEPESGDGSRNGGGVDLSDRDPLFEEAARLIVIQQQGSTSLIQRKFSIGYNRAGRLMDQLEAAGIVGPFEGSKARQVLIPDEYSLEQLLNSLK